MFTINKQKAFTLIEIIMFLVIVSTALGGITLLFVQTGKSNADPMIRQKAITIAYAYLDEISKLKWADESPNGGGCIETGSGDCASYCATLSPSNCGQCTLSGGSCVPIATNPLNALGSDSESRSGYDDIDDFHGVSDSPPLGASGANLTNYTGFTVGVQVTEPGANWNAIPNTDVRKIVVTVDTPTGESLDFVLYRVNF